jgi:hypothetical protein
VLQKRLELRRVCDRLAVYVTRSTIKSSKANLSETRAVSETIEPSIGRHCIQNLVKIDMSYHRITSDSSGKV